jgi:hypothetical protein
VQKVTFVVSTILDLELWIYFGFCFLNFGFNAMLSPNKSGFTNIITVFFRKNYMREYKTLDIETYESNTQFYLLTII